MATTTTTTEREPVRARNCTARYEDGELVPAAPDAVIPWSEARDRLAGAQVYWLATVRPDGQPHVRPVLAVWVDGALCTTTNPRTPKGRSLAGAWKATMTVSTDGMDLVVEGDASRLDDQATLAAAAEAYRDKYGWPVTVADRAFEAPYGAPAAGPPPYEPYRVTPVTVFGLGTDERFASRSTRWDLR